MSALSTWYLKVGVSKFKTGADDCQIVYRPNEYSESTLTFPDSTALYTNSFTEESEVQVYIGDPDAGGVKMLHGFIDFIDTIRQPSRERSIVTHIVDWGSYLAAKRIFEKKYFRSIAPNTVLSQTLSSVTDGVDTLTGANIASITGNLKQEFIGTYVKDVWNNVAEQFGADYFVDETLDLNAFPTNSKFLEQSVGNTYRIRDIAPTLARDLQILHRKSYNMTLDVSQRFRNVTVTNGLVETYPSLAELDVFQTQSYKEGQTMGKVYSQYYQMGLQADYQIDTTTIKPVEFFSAKEVGAGVILPTIRLNVASASQNIGTRIEGHNEGTVSPFNLPIDDFLELSFYFYNGLAGAAITNLTLNLVQDGTNYFSRSINAYIAAAWRYFRYQLPSTTSNSESYTGVNWTKTGNPTKINYVYLEFTPGTGYTASSFIEMSRLFFYTTKRATSSAAGNPPTQKIIVNKNLKNTTQMAEFAATEKARINKVVKRGNFTILGNTNFRKPAYLIDIDFTTTLGTGRSALGADGARMELIRHYLEDGEHLTDVQFNNAFYRP